jgi:hypothetical protein
MFSFLAGDGLSASDVEMLYVIGAACLPSVIALLLALVAHWLPDEGYVPSQDRRDRARLRVVGADEDDGDWRRAA